MEGTAEHQEKIKEEEYKIKVYKCTDFFIINILMCLFPVIWCFPCFVLVCSISLIVLEILFVSTEKNVGILFVYCFLIVFESSISLFFVVICMFPTLILCSCICYMIENCGVMHKSIKNK